MSQSRWRAAQVCDKEPALISSAGPRSDAGFPFIRRAALYHQILIVLLASATFLVGCLSPPHLMDDVDATQGQIAKTMLQTGDWVTARLDGVKYLEKAPLKYWITATLYSVLGVHDWVARLPNGIAVVLLCFLVYRVGLWAGDEKTGYYAGMVLATSIGLFLFTRIVIPDVILTLAISVAVWAFLRAIDEREQRTRRWAAVFYFSLGCGVLLKGLIGLVFPVGICLVWLAFQKRLLDVRVWRSMRPLMGLGIFVAVAAPWHILAILRNPPYFDLTLRADPHFGQKFRGFFWFYFINDQFLRFTNGRWPRDYNTVPRVWFWLYHLVWFFPWSFYLVGLRPAQFSEPGRLSRLRTMCLVWIGVIMLFFSLSTTQEYYSMPIYPALALLIGTAMTGEHRTIVRAARAAGVLTSLACAACVFLIVKSWGLPTPGDISDTLRQNPDMYTLALGHMTDLTFTAFAYLRLPLAIAAVAFLIGTVFLWSGSRSRIYIGSAVMLVFFFQAARLALVVFDPYMSSYTLASALIAAQAAGRDPEVVQGPAKDGKRSGESVVRGSLQPAGPGTVIFNGQYYDFSSIPYYASCSPLLLNGRVNNLEYGSYAPDAPHVFISNDDFVRIWSKPERAFVVTYDAGRKNLEDLVGRSHLVTIAESGGKQLLTNSELSVRDDLRKDSRP